MFFILINNLRICNNYNYILNLLYYIYMCILYLYIKFYMFKWEDIMYNMIIFVEMCK